MVFKMSDNRQWKTVIHEKQKTKDVNAVLTGWRQTRIPANHLSDKGLVSRI